MGLSSILIFQGFFTVILFIAIIFLWTGLGNEKYNVKSRKMLLIMLFLAIPFLGRAFGFMDSYMKEMMFAVVLLQFIIISLMMMYGLMLYERLRKARVDELEGIVNTKVPIKDDINREIILPEIMRLGRVRSSISNETRAVEKLKKEHLSLEQKANTIKLKV
ncbi:hypothetical protein J4231_02490, partial [Candidatus Woesearchaeota archaeon]|nr:hypothetical protein [Candidatus Woesearchaeota archaeon]